MMFIWPLSRGGFDLHPNLPLHYFQHEKDVCTKMAGVWPEPYPVYVSDNLDRVSEPFQSLAQHYDLLHINLHHLMSKGILGLPGELQCGILGLPREMG